MSLKTLLLASALIVGMAQLSTTVPLYAFCKVIWLFGIPCPDINMALVNQIKSISQYELGTASPRLITAHHTSLDGLQSQSLNFTMTAIAAEIGCRLTGSAISDFWFRQLDNGTNFCSLYNIVGGSGIISAPGYTQYTNEWICLGFSLATCKP